MDNMNTMDFNQKIDVSLRASLEATPVERNASDDLSTGSSSDGFWNLIVLYTGLHRRYRMNVLPLPLPFSLEIMP